MAGCGLGALYRNKKALAERAHSPGPSCPKLRFELASLRTPEGFFIAAMARMRLQFSLVPTWCLQLCQVRDLHLEASRVSLRVRSVARMGVGSALGLEIRFEGPHPARRSLAPKQSELGTGTEKEPSARGEKGLGFQTRTTRGCSKNRQIPKWVARSGSGS